MDNWIDNETKLMNINQNYQREPLESICLHFCYVDSNNCVVNVQSRKHVFENNSNTTLSETAILGIINGAKVLSGRHFVFSELSVFHVDLEPENLASFDAQGCFRTLPLLADVHFSPSLFIFKHLSCLFFLFKQKSCLKESSSSTTAKKVSFNKKKFTRRILI